MTKSAAENTEKNHSNIDSYADVITKMFDKLTDTGNLDLNSSDISKNNIPVDFKMKTIEFEFDSDKDIKVEGRKIIVTHKHFPIKIKASTRDGGEVKRVVSLKVKYGIPRILLS